ncbi:MAG: hypothetical protein HW390_407 [Candidatus Brocadiaceae bacterium]|nr:hypothetical protein [Candidatus Brocadiaceae bacterium]
MEDEHKYESYYKAEGFIKKIIDKQARFSVLNPVITGDSSGIFRKTEAFGSMLPVSM